MVTVYSKHQKQFSPTRRYWLDTTFSTTEAELRGHQWQVSNESRLMECHYRNQRTKKSVT